MKRLVTNIFFMAQINKQTPLFISRPIIAVIIVPNNILVICVVEISEADFKIIKLQQIYWKFKAKTYFNLLNVFSIPKYCCKIGN